jgi:hypothetical protein
MTSQVAMMIATASGKALAGGRIAHAGQPRRGALALILLLRRP